MLSLKYAERRPLFLHIADQATTPVRMMHDSLYISLESMVERSAHLNMV